MLDVNILLSSFSNSSMQQFGFGALQRPPKGSRTPETDPKWSPQLAPANIRYAHPRNAHWRAILIAPD